jgi:hypothetical protein
MAKSIITATITGDSRGLRTSIDQADTRLGQFSNNVGRIARGVGRAIGGIGLAFAGAALAAKPLIDAASDLDESVSRADQVFGNSADSIQNWSQSAASSLGIARAEALDAAGTFGILGQAAGFTGGDLNDFSTSLVEAAADMASFNNLTPEETLAKLQAGLNGSSEPLRSVGVFLDEAAVAAKAAEMGLGGLGGELTQQDKIAARYALIMEQLGGNGTLGDFARTSDGVANQSRILSARFTDLQAKIGQRLLPVAAALASGLLRLVGFAERVGAAFSEGGLAGVVDMLRERFGWMEDKVRANLPLFAGLATAVGVVLVAALVAMAAAAWAAVAPILVMAAPFIAVAAAAGLLAAGFVYLYTEVEMFRRIVDIVIDAVVLHFRVLWTIAQTMFNIVSGVVTSLIGIFRNLPGNISTAVRGVFDPVENAATGAYDWVADKVASIVTTFRNLPGQLAGIGAGTFDFLWGAFRSAVNRIIDSWNRLEFRIPGFDPPGPGPTFGGFTLGVPDIPRLAAGGIVSSPTLAMIGEGRHQEAVVPLGKAGVDLGGSTNITINMPPGSNGDDVVRALRRWTRSNGPLPFDTRAG